MENTTKNLKKTEKTSKKAKPAESSKQKGSDKRTESSKEKKRDFYINSDVEAAAQVTAVLWRTHKIRLAPVEDHKLSIQNKMEEIFRRWSSTKQTVGEQTSLLQQQMSEEGLHQTTQLSLPQSEQELKKLTEYLQLLLDRVIEQDQSVIRAHREELAQWKESVQKEEEAKHAVDQSVWDRGLAMVRESEEQKLLRRQQVVEEFEFQMRTKMFDMFKNFTLHRTTSLFQSLELELHQVISERLYTELKLEGLTAENDKLKGKYRQAKAKLSSVSSVLTLSKGPADEKHKQLMDKELKKLMGKAQVYEDLQRKNLRFLLADAMKFEKMWLTLDEEVKELLERALDLDSTIYQQVLHLSWEQPELSCAEPWRRFEETSMLLQSSRSSQEQNQEPQNQERHSKAEEKSHSPRTVHKLMEILCEEAGFLIEFLTDNELQSLDENERTRLKAGCLFKTLGIKDVSQLVDFLCEYDQQSSRRRAEAEAAESRCSTGEVQTSPTAPVTSDPIDPTDILQALNVFINHHERGSPMQRHLQLGCRDKWSVQSLKVLDMSKEEAYWESLSSTITAHKLYMWEAAERSLQQHHAVLCQMSELLLEIQTLQPENSELNTVLVGLQEL
ncbi:dynein regulatory complex protein 1-like isoform X2 [Boleophthalmus pectinirostris]|nr:dynein regulatory complex protein 1-like isoform X2 [Boleophthalmus pectinirostris]